MKKYIPYVLITILLMVIASGVTYIIMDNRSDNKVNENNNQNNGTNNNDNNDNEQEQITLSESELEEYLSYVPNDEEYFDRNVYKKNKIDINTIDKTLLRDMAILSGAECIYANNCPFDTSKEIELKVDLYPYYEGTSSDDYIPLSYINNLLSKMYNYKLTNLKNATSTNDIFDVGGMGYIYQDEYFIMTGGGSAGGKHINYLEKYEANKDELIIYEYTAYYNYQEKILIDYNTNKEIQNLSFENPEIIKNYLKDNKSKFTQYKHTFKKNNTGYYWYSTEVVEN